MEKVTDNTKERPVFVKLEGGSHRAKVDFLAARESILGGASQRSGGVTSGQRIAADRELNRSINAALVLDNKEHRIKAAPAPENTEHRIKAAPVLKNAEHRIEAATVPKNAEHRQSGKEDIKSAVKTPKIPASGTVKGSQRMTAKKNHGTASSKPAAEHLDDMNVKPAEGGRRRQRILEAQAKKGALGKIKNIHLLNSIKTCIKKSGLGGNYQMGTVGAVLGMLVACIVAIAVLSIVPRLNGVISTLIPVWAATGYLTFNGKREKSPVPAIIIFAVSLAGIFLITFATDITAPVISRGMSFKRSMHLFKGNIGDLKYWLTTFYHILIPVIFVLLGMAMSVPKLLRKPVKRKRRTAAYNH